MLQRHDEIQSGRTEYEGAGWGEGVDEMTKTSPVFVSLSMHWGG